jgi:hypothetical protein
MLPLSSRRADNMTRVAVLFLAISSIAFPRDVARGSPPTLEDTMDWIVTRLSETGYSYVLQADAAGQIYSTKRWSGACKNCTLNLDETWSDQAPISARKAMTHVAELCGCGNKEPF